MATKKSNDIPTFDKLIIPLVEALKELGGSGSIEEIYETVIKTASLSEQQLSVQHGDGRTEVQYRLAWARTYLKKYGILENSSRGIWALTKSDISPKKIDVEKLIKSVRETSKGNSAIKPKNEADKKLEEVEIIENWKEALLNCLYNISPAAFERLCQRILRESGFTQVEVTGKTGDGGIDGKGIVRLNGFLSFHVIFQCKRYKGSVSPSQIRDFRGAMQGRADKGLFITTGSFTRDAVKEATRDGAPAIDLIDGELLCDKLKELKLGVETELVEKVSIKHIWFNVL